MSNPFVAGMIILSVSAAVNYVLDGDIPRFVYWLSAAAISASALVMK